LHQLPVVSLPERAIAPKQDVTIRPFFGGNTMSWIDKKAQASKLVAEVKALNAEGIDSGEKAAEAHKKMAEVQSLMTEVKAERLEEDKQKLTDLLDRYDTKAVDAPAPHASAGVPIATKTVDLGRRNPAEDTLTVSTKAMQLMQLEGKAMSEGVPGDGGYLVPPEYMQHMFAAVRGQGNALRKYGWLAIHPVSSNQILFPRSAGTTTFGLVAELAPKPVSQTTVTQVPVSIYTGAGMTKVSNQLIADSSPTVVDTVTRSLGRSAGSLEEQLIISGTGTGQPRGILATTGVNPITQTATTAQGTIDAVIDAIAAIQQTYFASPTGILMAPRRLATLQKGKTTDTGYLFNPAGQFSAPAGNFIGGGVTSDSSVMTMPSLMGFPIGTSSNMPTNLGTGTNEDRIIVADWGEAHFFQRSTLELRVSDTAGDAFETNVTVFRLEERFGFTAEHYPQAFAVIGGAGLAV
jgi:HK97 family phage major capsid protein